MRVIATVASALQYFFALLIEAPCSVSTPAVTWLPSFGSRRDGEAGARRRVAVTTNARMYWYKLLAVASWCAWTRGYLDYTPANTMSTPDEIPKLRPDSECDVIDASRWCAQKCVDTLWRGRRKRAFAPTLVDILKINSDKRLA